MILVMSGTEEGREIVKALSDKGKAVVTTVATEYGREIYEKIGLAICAFREGLILRGCLNLYGVMVLKPSLMQLIHTQPRRLLMQ